MDGGTFGILDSIIPGIIVIFCLGLAVGYGLGILLAGTSMMVWLLPVVFVSIGLGVFVAYVVHFILNSN